MKRTPMPRRSTPMKRTRLNPVGKKAKREASALDRMRLAVHLRSGGMCEVRTPSCPGGVHEGTDVHHKAPSDRDRGVHLAERALLCCAQGHAYLHTHPAEAYAKGWLIRDGVTDA